MKSIYAITPSGVNFEKLIKEIEKMLSMGIKLFQYREKGLSEEQMKINASIMLEVINKNNGKLIINDSPKIAIEIGADGFHLGMEDYLNSKNLKFIKEHKDMINLIGVGPTPAIFLENGEAISGYKPYNEILTILREKN